MKKLLIVEDDETTVQTLAIRFTRAGYLVYTAVDMPMGVKKLCETDPDLIVLDIGLPGGEGFAIAEKARTLPKEVPIIYITASESVEHKEKAVKLGAVAYFEKPVKFDELLGAVKEALGQ